MVIAFSGNILRLCVASAPAVVVLHISLLCILNVLDGKIYVGWKCNKVIWAYLYKMYVLYTKRCFYFCLYTAISVKTSSVQIDGDKCSTMSNHLILNLILLPKTFMFQNYHLLCGLHSSCHQIDLSKLNTYWLASWSFFSLTDLIFYHRGIW